jgi:cytochrome c556
MVRGGEHLGRGNSMTLSVKHQLFGAAVTIALTGLLAISATALDVAAVLKDRQTTMKQQAKDLGSIKAFLEGKGDQAAAEAAAASLTRTTQKIPALFPPGSDKASPDGDFAPKAAIWNDWDKFLNAQKAAAGKAEALLAAVKAGDKASIRTAFLDLGKNGCGNCHTPFREKLKP